MDTSRLGRGRGRRGLRPRVGAGRLGEGGEGWADLREQSEDAAGGQEAASGAAACVERGLQAVLVDAVHVAEAVRLGWIDSLGNLVAKQERAATNAFPTAEHTATSVLLRG